MADELRDRARRFLELDAPEPSASIAGSLTEGMIRRYLAGGPWPPEDAELRDLLRFCYFTAETEVEFSQGAVQAYAREYAAVLRGIVREVYGPDSLE